MSEEKSAIAIKLFQLRWTDNLTNISASVLMLHDVFLTLNAEVRFFWKGRWSVPRLLYFTNRYWPLLIQVINNCLIISASSSVLCETWLWFIQMASNVTLWALQTTLIYRIHALYASKMVLFGLVLLFLTEVGAHIGIAIWANQIFYLLNTPLPFLPSFHVCVPNTTKPGYNMTWMPTIGFEAILFILALYQLVRRIQSHRQRTKLILQPDAAKTLAEYVLRDTIWYFFAAFTLDLTGYFVFKMSQSGIVASSGYFSAVFSMFGSRLLLRLRQVDAEQCGILTTDGSTATAQDIMFANPSVIRRQRPQRVETSLQNTSARSCGDVIPMTSTMQIQGENSKKATA